MFVLYLWVFSSFVWFSCISEWNALMCVDRLSNLWRCRLTFMVSQCFLMASVYLSWTSWICIDHLLILRDVGVGLCFCYLCSRRVTVIKLKLRTWLLHNSFWCMAGVPWNFRIRTSAGPCIFNSLYYFWPQVHEFSSGRSCIVGAPIDQKQVTRHQSCREKKTTHVHLRRLERKRPVWLKHA